MPNKKVCIGIPSYSTFPADTEEDYMRLMYHLGRRCQQYDFLLAIKRKSEQFRARNAIVEAALQTGCDYLWMLDDDHVIDWQGSPSATVAYDLPVQLIGHLEADARAGICGALYWQRGSQCLPVVMKMGTDGGYYWLRDDQLTNSLQEVAVTGGGCMMIKASIFDRIKSPWFSPEYDLGTDIQICQKAREAGFSVWCDTSRDIGHVTNDPQIITRANRDAVMMDNARKYAGANGEGVDQKWANRSALNLYRADAEEYLGKTFKEMLRMAEDYDQSSFAELHSAGRTDDYYRGHGDKQLARQVWFHHSPFMQDQFRMFLSMLNFAVPARGVDFGCGSAPIGFEAVMRGHSIDFIDIDGAGGYEFLKWRAKKRGVESRCGWSLGDGPYDYAMFFDSIEHLEDWRGVLSKVIHALKPDGALITNYFLNGDFKNPEHISMDHNQVKRFLNGSGVYPLNNVLWVKKDLGFMDKEKSNERSIETHGAYVPA